VEVIGTLNRVLDINILVEPLICILGSCDTSMYTSPTGNTIRPALFVAGRQIALKWTFPHPPTVSDWIVDLNRIILFEDIIGSFSLF